MTSYLEVLRSVDTDGIRLMVSYIDHPVNIDWELDSKGSDYWDEVSRNLVSLLPDKQKDIEPEVFPGTPSGMYTSLAELLSTSFVWRVTKQGNDYWDDLYCLFERRAKENNTTTYEEFLI